MGLSDADAGKLAKRIPRQWHPDPRRRAVADLETLIADMDDTRHQQIVRQAVTLVGIPHHLSVHPGGVVITPGPLTDYVPLQHAPKGFAITQFDHSDVETLGLVKVDLLGIRALTVMADAARLIQRRHDSAFQLAEISTDDALTAALLARAETVGIFQCESTGAQRTLRQLKARTPHDLAVANAFFKPGPATGGMADLFVRRYRGEAPVAFLHLSLEPILRSTQGVLIFQEQILRVATEIAGLSWPEAEHLRRGMSKFRPDEMERMREKFVAGCQRVGGPGLAPGEAKTLWDQVAAFAGYGFNQGHATAYAMVSYRSAYLKDHYPAEFLCARLADWGGFHHQAVYIAEARRLGIPVRPPHVNRSGRRFTLVYARDNAGEQKPILYMGLEQVRSLRRATIKAIVSARKERSFGGLRDLTQRVHLQPKEVLHLIRCGALDGLERAVRRCSMKTKRCSVRAAATS
jgi:DNA polymerase III subunit alpha